MDSGDLVDMAALIARAEERLKDLRARMPAHSVPPAMQWEMEELEEELARLLQRRSRG
jgi:hypothetical protein